MDRFTVAVAAILAGCAHPTFDLRSHEENHCREFNVPREQWIYRYDSPAAVSRACRDTGYPGTLFVDACAQRVKGDCIIRLPKGDERETR